MNSWKFVSAILTLSLGFFVLGQSCLTLRPTGILFLPDIIVFPPFVLAIAGLLLAAVISIAIGGRQKRWVKLGYLFLGFLTLLSFFQGHLFSLYAIREAVFNQYGIGAWMAFLLAIPASNEKFWVYFKRHFLLLFNLLLFIQVFAILLLINGNEGLMRLNFSTSVSLFILAAGILSSDKAYFWSGLIGLGLFEMHSFIHDQRESFLLPLEFMALFLPVYLFRSFHGQKEKKFNRAIKIISLLYVMALVAGGIFFMMSAKYKKAAEMSMLTRDTRSTVVEDYLASEMLEPRNLLLGKGVNGYYKSSRRTMLGGAGTSDVIEIGYLQMILNVGLLYVLIMFLLGFFPSLKAIFKSRNPLAAVAGLWILVRLANMVYMAKPSTSLDWFLFWICIGIIHSTGFPDIANHRAVQARRGPLKSSSVSSK